MYIKKIKNRVLPLILTNFILKSLNKHYKIKNTNIYYKNLYKKYYFFSNTKIILRLQKLKSLSAYLF